jgi:hypothetical protein
MRWEFVFGHLAALHLDHAHKVPTYSREFVNRAIACLTGAAPLDVLSGPKTRAFYGLLSGRDCDAVVIDGHAFNIARGACSPIRGGAPAAAAVTKARYRKAAAAYREVADLVGEPPHAVQAATWIFWREALDISESREYPDTTNPEDQQYG